MGDALQNSNNESDEELDTTGELSGEVTETREEQLARLKSEFSALKAEGLTDAEAKDVIGEIANASESANTESEAHEEAETIAENLEEEHGVTMSDSQIDKLAKRIVELSKGTGSTPTPKRRRIPTAKPDENPRRSHFTERRLFGGNR